MTLRHILLVSLAAAACAGPQRQTADSARRVRTAMAEQLLQRGDWAGAFAAADALCRDDPGDLAARGLRGSALRHQHLLGEAESDFRMVIKGQPRNPAARAELALLLEEAGRRDEALEHHREAHRLAPGDARYLNDLGFALTVGGKPAEAVLLLEEALRVEPGNPRYRNNLGFARAAGGDLARAAQEFSRAGPPPQARNNLGLAYERAGDFEHAYELYLESWRLDPDPKTLRNLEFAAQQLARSLPPDASAAGKAWKEGT